VAENQALGHKNYTELGAFKILDIKVSDKNKNSMNI
jgi:hypothetical protein